MISKSESEQMELTDVDKKLLDELRKGRCTQGYLVEATNIPRYKVHERLKLFKAAGITQNIHSPTALWELIHDPRDQSSGSTAKS